MKQVRCISHVRLNRSVLPGSVGHASYDACCLFLSSDGSTPRTTFTSVMEPSFSTTKIQQHDPEHRSPEQRPDGGHYCSDAASVLSYHLGNDGICSTTSNTLFSLLLRWFWLSNDFLSFEHFTIGIIVTFDVEWTNRSLVVHQLILCLELIFRFYLRSLSWWQVR